MTKFSTKLNAIDLFCGAGGLSDGFKQAGFNIVLGIDNVESYVKTFKTNHKDTEVILDDIRNITNNQIKSITGDREIHVIIGGPPCQSYSIAGRRDPNDPRDSLFMEFVRVVRYFQPSLFLMENVLGIKSKKMMNGRKAIEVINEEFSKIGYKTNNATLLAADFGVPQRRKRVFVIGTKADIEFDFPHPTNAKNGPIEVNGKLIDKWVPVGDVLLPRRLVEKKYYHSQKMIEGFRRRVERNKKNGWGWGWQILDESKPSYTISARYWKDGADALVKYSESEIRMLTPLECARIQGFSESFIFKGSKKEIYKQIGNAVPPPLAKAIAEEIKKILKEKN